MTVSCGMAQSVATLALAWIGVGTLLFIWAARSIRVGIERAAEPNDSASRLRRCFH